MKVDRVRVTDAKTRVESSRLPIVLEVGRRAVLVVLSPRPYRLDTVRELPVGLSFCEGDMDSTESVLCLALPA